MFEKVKRFFGLGLYTKAQVGRFVLKGILTAEQYEAIVGEPFPAEKGR